MTLQQALEALDSRLWQEALGYIEPSDRLAFVEAYAPSFLSIGAYEPAAARAYIGHKTEQIALPAPEVIERIFRIGDRAKHTADLPPGDPITVYRGTSRAASYGREGTSWTLCRGLASWFAQNRGGSNPTVWKATIRRDEVLAYLADGGELEVICRRLTASEVFPLPAQVSPSETSE
jgi:hypothetical protein